MHKRERIAGLPVAPKLCGVVQCISPFRARRSISHANIHVKYTARQSVLANIHAKYTATNGCGSRKVILSELKQVRMCTLAICNPNFWTKCPAKGSSISWKALCYHQARACPSSPRQNCRPRLPSSVTRTLLSPAWPTPTSGPAASDQLPTGVSSDVASMQATGPASQAAQSLTGDPASEKLR